jgi:hypothetical protein
MSEVPLKFGRRHPAQVHVTFTCPGFLVRKALFDLPGDQGQLAEGEFSGDAAG